MDCDLFHILPDLIPTPTWHIPIVVILFCTPNTKGSINTTWPTEKLPPTDFNLSTIGTWIWGCYDVPIGICIKVLRPMLLMRYYLISSVGGVSYQPPTMWVFSRSELCWPASMTRTELLGSSASRAARTGPEVPPLREFMSYLVGIWKRRYSPADNVIERRALRLYVDICSHIIEETWILFSSSC